MCEKFDHLYSILEDRKVEMNSKIVSEQDEKLSYIRGLQRKYGDHLETMSKVVETGIQNMDEPEMAIFLQVMHPHSPPPHPHHPRGGKSWGLNVTFPPMNSWQENCAN